MHTVRGHVGGKVGPPGQGRRSRPACPPADLREGARATSGSKKYGWGGRSGGVYALCVGLVITGEARSSHRAKAGAAGPLAHPRTSEKGHVLPQAQKSACGGEGVEVYAVWVPWSPLKKKKRGTHEYRSPVSGLGRKRDYSWGAMPAGGKRSTNCKQLNVTGSFRHVLVLGHVPPKRSRSRTSKATRFFHLITANKRRFMIKFFRKE